MAEETLRYQLYFHRSEQRVFNDYDRITQFYQDYLTQSPAATFPSSCPYFTGRQAEQHKLKLWLEQAAGSNKPRIVTISGAVGTGKTTLAIHLAHQLKSIFPEFQLYAELQNPEVQPQDLNQILIQFLQTLGYKKSLPEKFSERLALFRSLIANQRGVIVLDNVTQIAQIQSLLPTETPSLIIITSPQRWVAPEAAPESTVWAGALVLELAALPKLEALELLQVWAKSLVQTEPEAASAIVEQCRCSPLAIALLGQLLQQQPQLTLRVGLEQLQQLMQFESSYPEVRASFLLIYSQLTPIASRLLRRIGVLAEMTLTTGLAAVLLDVEPEIAKAAIQQLLQVGLLQHTDRERYCLAHELLRPLLLRLLASEESVTERQLTRFRVSQSYWNTARWMNLSLEPTTRKQLATVLGKATAASVEQPLKTIALNWFATEKTNLLAAVQWMYQAERWDLVLRLADGLVDFLQARQYWQDLEQTQHSALEAARYLGDRTQEARVLNNLGNVAVQQGDWERAERCYEQSLTLLHHLKDHSSEARTLINIGVWHALQNQPKLAVAQWKTALDKLPAHAPEHQHLRKWIQVLDAAPVQNPTPSERSQNIFHSLGAAIKKLWQE